MKDSQSTIEKSPYLDKGFMVKLVVAIFLVFAALGMYELFLKTFQVFLLALAATLWAVLFRGVADWICEKTNMGRKWATFISVVFILAVIAGLGWLIFPSLSKQIQEFQQQIPQAIEEVKQQIKHLPMGERIVEELQHPEQLLTKGKGSVQSLAGSLFTSVFGLLGDVFIIIVVGFFLLASPHLYKSLIVCLFPKSRRKRAGQVLTYQYLTLKSWLAGKLFDMFVVAVLTTLGLWFLGVPLALTLGIMAGLLSFIPNLGPIIAQIPALLLAYLQGPQTVLYVFFLYNGIQLIESNLLLPLIQNHQVAIPPAFILLGQVLFGIAAGLFGIILTVPLLVLSMVLIKTVYLQDVLGDSSVKLQAKDGS